jgi:hypothetical protein
MAVLFPKCPDHGQMPVLHTGINVIFHARSPKADSAMKQVSGRSWERYCFRAAPMRCTFHAPDLNGGYMRGLAQDCLQEVSPEFTQFNGGID